MSAAPLRAQVSSHEQTGGSPAFNDPDAIRAAFDDALKAFDSGQYHQAYAIWLPLARNGDPAAQRNIAHLYRFGLGQPQDFEAAVAWYRRAADAGLARAQANLAMMYLRGQGVEQDPVQASFWMTGAAVQGHAIAQYNLALLYLRGDGVPRNEMIAAGWLFRAAQSGHAGALETLGRIVPKVSGPFGPPPPPPAWPGTTRPDSTTGPTAQAAPEADPPVPAPPSAKLETAGKEVPLERADTEPEEQPGFFGRIGKTLIEQTTNWLQADQDLGLERSATGPGAQ